MHKVSEEQCLPSYLCMLIILKGDQMLKSTDRLFFYNVCMLILGEVDKRYKKKIC